MILACATIASAKFHINEFAGKTCDLLDIWNQNTNTSSSVQYTQDNNEHSFLLSNDCQGQLKSILTKCEYLFYAARNIISNNAQV